MQLSDDLMKKLMSKIDSLWHPETRICPICQSQVWNVTDTIFELREFNRGSIVIGADSKIFPVIGITCKKCGYTIFFNAINLELINTPIEQIEKVKNESK